MLDSIPPAMRDARTKGIPQLGAGAIYPIPEEQILCDPFRIPYWWRHVYALDVGWRRTAAIWAAIDPETDTAYLTSEYYASQAEPVIHAAAIKARGAWIPGVIDPAAHGRAQRDGEQLFKIYTNPDTCGLNLVTADNAVEAGLLRVWERLSQGRMKVFRHLPHWLAEFRIYRRDEKGKVVKENDHLMDCTRYLEMSGVEIAAQLPRDRWKGLLNGGANQPQPVYNPFAEIDSRGGGAGTDPYRMG